MPTTTTKYALPVPTGAEAPDGPAQIGALAAAVDAKMAGYAEGTIAAIPAAGKNGRLYWATDEQVMYLDIGSAWIPASHQPGDLKLSARSTPTSGWLLADGSAVSRTTYSALYAALGGAGSPHGQGDGSTTFNLPDYRGRQLVGKGTHADVDSLGDNDGLAVGSRTPKHTHSVAAESPGTNSTGTHTHGVLVGSEVGNTSFNAAGLTPAATTGIQHIHGGNTDSQGSHSHVVNSHSHGGATGSQGGAFGVANVFVKT